MKILLMRHAESIDDLTDQYGGWLDLELTPRGRAQVEESAKTIEDLDIKFKHILHSPLKRAKETASIVGSELKLPVKELLYLKEKNGYGLLTGITREQAKKDYPDLVEAMDNGYVYGSEPSELFIERVIKGFQTIIAENNDVIVITHGGVLTQMLNRILGLNYIKAHDAGYILWDSDEKRVICSNNFDFKD